MSRLTDLNRAKLRALYQEISHLSEDEWQEAWEQALRDDPELALPFLAYLEAENNELVEMAVCALGETLH
jgi:hypothetical protein